MPKEEISKEVEKPPLEEPVDVDEADADSVSEDINKFKKFFQDLTGGVHKKAKPVASKVQQKVIEKTPDKIIEKVPKKRGMGWVKLLFIPVFIIFVALIMLNLAKDVVEENGNGGGPEPTRVEEPTPTIEPFQPVRESIYADDPEIARLQEELNVINNEMFSVPLRDSTLNPPILDFNIEFKD